MLVLISLLINWLIIPANTLWCMRLEQLRFSRMIHAHVVHTGWTSASGSGKWLWWDEKSCWVGGLMASMQDSLCLQVFVVWRMKQQKQQVYLWSRNEKRDDESAHKGCCCSDANWVLPSDSVTEYPLWRCLLRSILSRYRFYDFLRKANCGPLARYLCHLFAAFSMLGSIRRLWERMRNLSQLFLLFLLFVRHFSFFFCVFSMIF